MTSYDVNEPSYEGTTTEEWGAPAQTDFETDDLSEIGDHFVLSASGFPPENFTDLKLPVVDPSGDLNRNALQTAHGGAHSVESVGDIDDETVSTVETLLERLSDEAFGEEIG